MDFDFIYAPIVKGKANDVKAISYLSLEQADRTKPVFELPPFVELDDPEQVFARFVTRLSKLYPNRPCYVDLPLLKPGSRTTGGESVLAAAFGQLNALAINYEPTYGLGRDESLWPLVIHQARRSGGMLLRLEIDDMEFGDDTLNRVQDLTLMGLNTAQMDVLLDCRHLNQTENTTQISGVVASFMEQLALAFPVRKVIVSGSSALKTVTQIPKNSKGEVLRKELALWTNLRIRKLPFDAVYSDYGVIHPDFTDLTPSSHINGKIRYTHGQSFHIFRGHSLSQDDKYEQYRKLSHDVLNSNLFSGHSYSHGDRYIYDCATGHAKTGNAGTWVMNDLNHHFTYVIQQIARLEGFIDRGYPESAVLQMA